MVLLNAYSTHFICILLHVVYTLSESCVPTEKDTTDEPVPCVLTEGTFIVII